MALRRRLEPVKFLGTTTITENGIEKVYGDFDLFSTIADVILGIFLTADSNRLERTELYCNADLIAVDKNPISLSNERIFTKEPIHKLKLQCGVRMRLRIVYNKPGVEHSKVFVLSDLLPNEIRTNINFDEGNLTIPSSVSPIGKEVSMKYLNSELVGYPYPEQLEYYPVGKGVKHDSYSFIIPHGPYILSKIIVYGRQHNWLSFDCGEIYNYHLKSQPDSNEFIIPLRDGSPCEFKIYKCDFHCLKIHIGGLNSEKEPVPKLILKRISSSNIFDDIKEPEYVQLEEGKTAVYKEGLFRLYKIDTEN